MNDKQNALFYMILGIILGVYGFAKKDSFSLIGAVILASISFYWLWRVKKNKQGINTDSLLQNPSNKARRREIS